MTNKQIEMLGAIEPVHHLFSYVDQNIYMSIAGKADNYILTDRQKDDLKRLYYKVVRK